MSDIHGVVVDDVRKVVGGIAVCFDQNLILKLRVLNGNIAEHCVGKSRAALYGHFLADNIRNAVVKILLYLLLGEIAAVTVIAAADGFALNLFKALLCTKAAVRLALLDKLLGVGKIHILALRLHIGTVIAPDVGAFVVPEPRKLKGIINKINRSAHKPLAVGVLDPQNEFAALRLCYQILIKRGAQISYVHKSRGARRVTGADSFLSHKYTSNKKYAIQI